MIKSSINLLATRPNVWLLPQLWTDLLTWALSVYQQTAQAAVDTTSSEDAVTVQMMQART